MELDITQVLSNFGVGGAVVIIAWRVIAALGSRFVSALETCVKILTTLDERTRTDSDRLARVETRLLRRRREVHDTEENQT
jgi:hypothetical protein